MQSYVKKIVAAKVEGFSTAADLFVYESGTSAGDTRVKVRPETGGEIVLKPGQQFRWPEVIQRWSVETFDGASTIDASFILGTGEFTDANTLNKFTLDATFANNVKVTNILAEAVPVTGKVTNTTAERVPVTADLTQTIPVSIAGLVNVAGTTVQYTNSFADAGAGAVSGQQVFSAAQNPNGAFIELVELGLNPNTSGGASAQVSLTAKATASASLTDGDVVFLAATATGNAVQQSPINITQTSRIKIPAGKGLWLNQAVQLSAPAHCVKTVLYTLL
jgi:hypothetical protein